MRSSGDRRAQVTICTPPVIYRDAVSHKNMPMAVVHGSGCSGCPMQRVQWLLEEARGAMQNFYPALWDVPAVCGSAHGTQRQARQPPQPQDLRQQSRSRRGRRSEPSAPAGSSVHRCWRGGPSRRAREMRMASAATEIPHLGIVLGTAVCGMIAPMHAGVWPNLRHVHLRGRRFLGRTTTARIMPNSKRSFLETSSGPGGARCTEAEQQQLGTHRHEYRYRGTAA